MRSSRGLRAGRCRSYPATLMDAMPHTASTVDFLGIGVQKGGTTWLYHQLARHPQVTFPRGKEVHYWDTAPCPDADTWVRMLEPPTRCSRTGRPIKTGEITPAYAMLSPTSIEAIRRRCPDVRLFISLRNPVERAWSAALMGLTRAQMAVHEASDQWFLDHFRSAASLARGDYAGCLERWLAVFPPDQLLVLFLDDIAARPGDVLASLARHIGIDAADFAALPMTAFGEHVVPDLGSGATSVAPPPLRPSLVGPLLDLYADRVAAIERLTGRDLSAWRVTPATRAPHGPRLVSPCGATRAADAEV